VEAAGLEPAYSQNIFFNKKLSSQLYGCT
jgi:hypothetical protein